METLGRSVECGACGTGLVEDANYCHYCGHKAFRYRECSSCPAKIPQDAKFCYECGSPQNRRTEHGPANLEQTPQKPKLAEDTPREFFTDAEVSRLASEGLITKSDMHRHLRGNRLRRWGHSDRKR